MNGELVEAATAAIRSYFGSDMAAQIVARAVIPVVLERLREPTPAMAEAGESGLAKAGVDDPNKVDACECWQAMFDAAIRGLGE